MSQQDIGFLLTCGIFTLTLVAAVQRFLQWREQRKHRKEDD